MCTLIKYLYIFINNLLLCWSRHFYFTLLSRIWYKLLRCLHTHSPFNTWFPIIRKSLLFLTFILTWIGYLKLSQLTLSTFLLILIIYYQRLFNFSGNICFNQLIRIWLRSLVFLNVLLEILIVRRCFTLTLV